MYDLEEQEQIDTLKAWWKRHGNKVTVGIALVAAVIAAAQGWRYYQATQRQQAAVLYDVLETVANERDLKKIREAAGQIMEKYPSTGYAPRAALISAAANYESGDAKSAKAQLQWVVDHASEARLKDTARLRLAGILLDEKAFADALKLLDAKHDAAFDGMYADLRGDVLVAQNKPADAAKAYQEALQKLDPKAPYRNLVQMKRDALGDAK
jgi:predicted negative regulator of RcsB-dependent stress response